MERTKKLIKGWGIPVLCGLLVIVLFRFILMLGYVPSTSMEPTISQNSYIVGTQIYGELQRGDIVIFRFDGRKLVKRIAAVPGDTVYVRGATVQINEPLEDAEMIIEVPERHFYMLGDNAAESNDSRYWVDPFVDGKDVLAKLLFHL